jgi:high-affinity nickel-transport protein
MLKKYSDYIPYVLVVFAMHILGITFLLIGGKQNTTIIGMGFVAYTLGLRHAFDADHIAAIDNTVRKLVQQKRNPKGVGFFFSIGHSTIVLIMAIITIFTVDFVQYKMPRIKELGGLVSVTVSAGFLILIGLVNLYSWIDILKTFISIRRGENNYEDIDEKLSSGVVNRLISRINRFISSSWHVYLLGLMFGLGFDTATQIAIITTSAGAASQSMSIITAMAFPVLFTSGMSLMDTTDGFFMVTAYQWVFSTPLRKIYYNLTVTGLSVVAALFIGFVEVIQIIAPRYSGNNVILNSIISMNFNMAGYILVILFIVIWLASFIGWKVLKMEEV